MHGPEAARSILRGVFSAQSTDLVDTEPAIPLDSLADVLPILQSYGLHVSPDIFLKLLTFGRAHMGEGHLISSSQFYYLAISPLPPAGTVLELPIVLHSDPSFPDDDIPEGANATLVRQWKEIRKEKEFTIMQYEGLKEDLRLSKLETQKLAAAEIKALQLLNVLEEHLSEKQNSLESIHQECRSINIKIHDMIRKAGQYYVEIERQDAVITQLEESASRHHSLDYAQTFKVEQLVLNDLQEEVTRFQAAKETLHTARSEGMMLIQLFGELELQLSQNRHEISSGVASGYHIPTALHLGGTFADEQIGEGEVRTVEVAIDAGPEKSSASIQTCPLNSSSIGTNGISGALEQRSTHNMPCSLPVSDPSFVFKCFEARTGGLYERTVPRLLTDNYWRSHSHQPKLLRSSKHPLRLIINLLAMFLGSIMGIRVYMYLVVHGWVEFVQGSSQSLEVVDESVAV